jgi:hypothetical protein
VTVLAAHHWQTNAHLIEDVARLYLDPADSVLDCTYGRGTWWKRYRPSFFTACDLDPAKSPIGHSVDFTAMPFADGSFDVVTFDPPYKLNGTATHSVDERYGVAGPYVSVAERHSLMVAGLIECARVSRRLVLAKCQNQVCSGRMWWQTDLLTQAGEECGLVKVDEFLHLGGRKQPMKGRTQKHPHMRPSSLLVFRKAS